MAFDKFAYFASVIILIKLRAVALWLNVMCVESHR